MFGESLHAWLSSVTLICVGSPFGQVKRWANDGGGRGAATGAGAGSSFRRPSSAPRERLPFGGGTGILGGTSGTTASARVWGVSTMPLPACSPLLFTMLEIWLSGSLPADGRSWGRAAPSLTGQK
jgi:hypothetical protein